MKYPTAFTVFICTLTATWPTSTLATPVVPQEVDDPSVVGASIKIVPPLSVSEAFVNPADLPPVDTSVFENDIDESFEAEKLKELKSRSGIVGDRYKWQTNIDFHISPAFSQSEYDTIYSALQTLAGIFSNCRVIRLVPGTGGDHVYITKQQAGCFSVVGRQGGRQNLNLGSGCVYRDIAVHEMIHAVGFHHEQIRPNRDSYINIFWGNIRSGTEHNFQTNPLYPNTYNVPYDYYSIMHYGETAFSHNGQKTIQAKSGVVVGSRGVVTDSDRRKVRAMYNCS